MGRKSKAEELSFEQAMARLEELVAEMERGETGLDRMIADFEEGMGLVQVCTRKLNEIERKIEALVKRGDEVATEPFDAEKAAEQEPPDGAG